MVKDGNDLKAFAELAERNSAEAFALFKNEHFPGSLPDEDHRARALWRGLMKPPVTQSAMEEFLCGLELKDPVTVRAAVTEASFYSVRDSVQETIRLRKNGWGSFVIRVRTDCDFIELPRRRFTEEHFIGNSCDVEYRILVGRLGNGVRRGHILLSGPSGEILFTVTASCQAEEHVESRALIDRNRQKLYRLRLDYMLEKSTRSRYVEESLKAIEAHYCMSTEDLSLMRLYQAYLEKLNGNAAEAAAILREFKDTIFSEGEREAEMACIYLRTLTGEGKEDPQAVSSRIRTAFDIDGGSYLMLKLLYLTNPDIGHYPRRRKKAAEMAFERGCRSPWLYTEILRDLRKDDALLTQLNECMVQTLVFAAKNSLLTEGLALRTAYLSANEKGFSAGLLKVLTSAYDIWPLDGILEAVVRLLMKGQPRDGSCFPWYEKAVARNLKIIRLYEYYAETMPESRRAVLPLQVRKYFALKGTALSEETRAAVYANIVRNRQTDPETYAVYREKAEAFAYEALSRGRIDANYATLYQEFVRTVRDARSAQSLADILFTERVYVDDGSVRSVAVLHDGLRGEEEWPVIRGTACIRCYTDDAQLLFENGVSGRYYTAAAYNRTPLMDKGALLPLLRAEDTANPGFLLYETRLIEDHACETEREFTLWRKAADCEAFTRTLRARAREQILSYVAAHPESGFFHQDTSPEVLKEYAEADRPTLVRVLLAARLYREAYGILLTYGTEDIPPEDLVRVASRMIDECGEEEDEALTGFCAEVFFGGKYDEQMLSFLTERFSGNVEEMLRLREAAAEFLIDTYRLDERILKLASSEKIRISEGPSILRDYMDHGGMRAVIRSYLELSSDLLTGTDEEVSRPVAEGISRIYDRGEPMDFAMKLTLLKYLSQQKELTAHEELQADALMEECRKRNLRFGFMKNLPAVFVRQYHLADRVFVEKKAVPSADVRISYRISGGIPGETETVREEMLLHRFRGIFSKEFTLFYGETLQYVITVRNEGTVTETEEKTVTASGAELRGADSYARINRMLRAAKSGETGALREELASYLRAKAVAEALFAPEEKI